MANIKCRHCGRAIDRGFTLVNRKGKHGWVHRSFNRNGRYSFCLEKLIVINADYHAVCHAQPTISYYLTVLCN